MLSNVESCFPLVWENPTYPIYLPLTAIAYKLFVDPHPHTKSYLTASREEPKADC